MGFLDKVKAQATELAKGAQDKVEGAQSKKRADGLLRDLGAWYYAERSGRGGETASAEIERLVSELGAYEAEHGPLGEAESTAPSESADKAGEATGGGDFTLDDL